MLISKKLIHFANIITQKTNIKKIHNKFNINTLSLFQFKKIFVLYNLLFQKFNWFELINFYINKNNIKLQIPAKSLFLFTSYILFSLLNNWVNLFFFKFHSLTKKQKKYTVLRAPCNHKNSKEQFGISNYKANFTINLGYFKKNFYNNFFLSSLLDKKFVGLTKIYKKYEKKNVL